MPLSRLLGIWALCSMASMASMADAFIAVADDEETKFPSKPDYKIGHRLAKGYKYLAHMQYVYQDFTLCGSGTWNITKPEDNVPVALLVRKGGCTIEQKALAASTRVYPLGTVKYVIVDGQEGMKESLGTTLFAHSNSVGDDAAQPLKIAPIPPSMPTNEDDFQFDQFDDAFPALTDDEHEHEQGQVNSDDLSAFINADDDDEGNEAQRQQALENDDESVVTTRSLRQKQRRAKKRNEDIKVVVLHVSYSVSNDLLDLMVHAPKNVRENGGITMYLDGREPPASTRTILLWIIMSACISAGACCCLLLCLSRGLWDDPPPAPPQRPVRRRLTNQQVRTNFPTYLCDAASSNPEDGTFPECSICLDEFSEGCRMRQLPCQHEFHSTCIARWLIERNASCPLCKYDVYEEEEDESDSDDDVSNAAPQMSMSEWISGFLLGGQQNQVAPVDAAPTNTTNGEGTAAATAATTAPSRAWWQSGRSLRTTPAAQATPPTNARASWWSFSSPNVPSNASVGDVESTNGGGRRWWFWQQRGSRQALTELTEPLLVAVENTTTEEVVAPAIDEAPEEAPSTEVAVEGEAAPETPESIPV